MRLQATPVVIDEFGILDQFFDLARERVARNGFPDEVRSCLSKVQTCRSILRRPERQITFFGVFKAGKSTVVNAILGAPILPMRANRATGVVTRIGFGETPSATVIRRVKRGVVTEQILLEEVERYALLDLSGTESKAQPGIEEIAISLPLPLLRSGCQLVGTPGLRDNEAMSERCLQEVARSDLAVMVLDATQLLSEPERIEAMQANELLNGNIVFLVNLINLVNTAEREQVMRYARKALAKLGNPVVGSGIVFPVSALPVLEARHGGWIYGGDEDGIHQFEQWLHGLMPNPAGEKIAALSRLGTLSAHLAETRALLDMRLAEASAEMERQQQSWAELKAQRERQHRQNSAEDKLALARFRAELTQLTNTFVTAVDAKAGAIMTQADWNTKVGTCFEEPLNTYIEKVNSGAKRAISGSDIKVPVFAIASDGTQVTAEDDISTWIGGAAGFLLLGWMDAGIFSAGAGAAAGAWVSKNIFGRDVKKETREKVKAAAKTTAPKLRAEAEKYLNSLEKQLDAHTKQVPRIRKPAALSRVEVQVTQYSEYVRWCEDFQRAVKSLQEGLLR